MGSRRRFLAQISWTSLAVGCGSQAAWGQVSTPTTETQPNASPQRPLVASVRDLGVQFRDNSVKITGQDAASAIPLPNGDAFWIFGDTVERPFKSIRNLDLHGMLSNTASIVPPQDASRGIKQFQYLTNPLSQRARQVIPFVGDEAERGVRVWGVHGVCVKPYIYLFYHNITVLKEVDVFVNFTLNGMGIARARIGEYQFERLTAPDGTLEFWKPNEPGFGVFVETLPDGFVYLWGSLMTGMFLSRTRPQSICDLSSYEYLVQAPTRNNPDLPPKWGKQWNSSAVLFDAVPNEMSAHYNPYLKKHIAIHNLMRDNQLVIRTAPQITGPWSEPEVFFRPQRITPDDLFSATKEHPEMAEDGGRTIYVTYVNSAVYLPHLLELRLSDVE